MLIPFALIAWFVAGIFKRPEWFAWASIAQVSITIACIAFYFFGTVQNSYSSGITAGLICGLLIFYAGIALFKRARKT